MYALTLEAAKTLMNDYNNNKISFINDFIVPEGFNPERVYAGISALDTRDLGLPALVDVTGKPIYTDEESEFKSDTVSLNKNNKSQKISGNVVTLNNGISVTLPEDFEGDEKDAKNYALNLIYQNDKDKNAIQYFQNIQEIQKLRKQMSNLPSNDMENINKLQEQINILEDENLFLTKE
jgi:leucyl aminopeptidase